jgi:proline dehydrogenase
VDPMRSLFLALSESAQLRQVAVGFGPARAMARRFVAGEELEEAVSVVHELNGQGVLATLDPLGENVTSETEARDATNEILSLIEAIQANGLQSGVSVKLTQLGLDLGPWLVTDNLQRVVALAMQANRFVRIDMESSDYVQTTLDLFKELWASYRNVGVVIQSYLYRSVDDVTRLIDMGASIRLVKGAYNEPSEVAFPDKRDTDANFVRLMQMLFSEQAQANGVYPAIATHDTKLIDWAKGHTQEQGISKKGFEFQMLYGIRTGLQRQLVEEGYKVRIYVPYGQQWYPYFMRRLAERPANVLFLVRNLLRS